MVRAYGRLALVAALVALASVPVDVEAQGSTAEREAAARQHFERGRTLYDQGRFLEAAAEFESAYALEPRPVILYNIGTAYEGALEPGRAAEAYERYVSTSDRPDEAEVRARIARLRELEGNRAATRTPATTETPATQTQPPATQTQTQTQTTQTPATQTQTPATTETPTRTPAEPATHAPPTRTAPVLTPIAPAAAATPPPASREPPPSASSDRSGLGVAAAVVGAGSVIATGVAIGLGVAALGEKSTLDDNCNMHVCPATVDGEPAGDVIDRMDSLAVLSTLFGVVGLVAGGAAIVLAIVAATGGSDAGDVAVAPFASPEGGGLAAEARF